MQPAVEDQGPEGPCFQSRHLCQPSVPHTAFSQSSGIENSLFSAQQEFSAEGGRDQSAVVFVGTLQADGMVEYVKKTLFSKNKKQTSNNN